MARSSKQYPKTDTTIEHKPGVLYTFQWVLYPNCCYCRKPIWHHVHGLCLYSPTKYAMHNTAQGIHIDGTFASGYSKAHGTQNPLYKTTLVDWDDFELRAQYGDWADEYYWAHYLYMKDHEW